MDWPAIIQSVGGAISAIILALVGWQMSQVRSLKKRIESLEWDSVQHAKLFREAIRFIRSLLKHIDSPELSKPEIPMELEDLI